MRHLILSVFSIPLLFADSKGAPPQTAASVDLRRYTGKWYEIARFPNRFQKDCAGEVRATYNLRPDGKIDVLNECRKADGSMKSARGTAKVVSRDGSNSRLKVTFFWPFYGDYWILALDPEYRWALVGDPGRRYLWILSREPRMDEAEYAEIVGRAELQGFDAGRLGRTRQESGA